ncbi:MAG: T9SS type A sorting domain-containing protein [Candidatus Symbiothrix sp.]|jgi:hypothetical protein|nr:T9SS type A sorting domain-containing protein [Candidatus Symbiothrix sp.]
MKKTLFFLCLFTVFYCNAQKKYYVKPGGTLKGSSWGWASGDLQGTIDRASAGDIVYVAVGVYEGHFLMKEGVEVRGGYSANISNPEERYPISDVDPAHHSILDGKLSGRPLTQLTPFAQATVWDGFVIQNGRPSVNFQNGSIIYSQNGDNKIVGVLYQFDEESKTGKMIGTREIRSQWGGYETQIADLSPLIDRESAKNNLTGQANAEKIISELGEASIDFKTDSYNGNYAAFRCDTFLVDGFTEWYLPAPGEWRQIKEAGIGNILKSVGKNLNEPFWTSTQVGSTLGWAYCFNSDYCHPALKYVEYPVSAIHDFVAPENPDGIYVAGGGVFLAANGILKNCIVTANASPSKGGGVYVGRNGQLIDCQVEGNDAPEGKEIYYALPSGIETPAANILKIYPNPVKAGETLHIDINGYSMATYRYINVHGQTSSAGILVSEKNTLTAPSSKGIYILSIQSDKGIYSTKLLIN